MGSMTSKPWLLFVLLLILSYGRACFSISGDTLSPGHSLSLSNSGNIKDNIVWIANRENPLSDLSLSRLDLSEDGNLLLFGGSSGIECLLTNLTFPHSTEAVLGEDGNFVLRDRSNTSSILWESFDHPTDTWLLGAKIWIDNVTRKQQQLVSWKNSEDLAPEHSFSITATRLHYANWHQSLDYPSLMENDGNNSNHFDTEERGVQAFRTAVDAQSQQFHLMERSLQALQQVIAGLRVDGNRNREHNRNRDHEEAHGHPESDRGPGP
ncbi:G-type lectin S-receptor-like serine/threonine-protein kinase At2g19130 [Alnus glutinosa]|uniref:G-type lectin S-receptor-like serine/threonine-protein kinase At2g19130 n=1 Tax=Alnus glutinosa TaxID=3517 RepID=UPI002D76F05D|nr:G-type lectin S-receptor-like serine/threonine-protein kinase At2g19130 [Alnus glutinosa]